ncbi:MAG TPA: hypothetical protein VNR86_00615 [Sphingomicrobium sp.]|nr:hypothetical protein [Sphingomicrobium sp.]
MDRDQGSRWFQFFTKAHWAAALFFFAIAIAYPIWRGLIAPKPEVDFRSFWFAGYLWAQGKNPYASSFSELGKALLPPGNHVQWFYPPNWWLVCRALALFDLPTSLTLWRITLTLILLGATFAVVWMLTRGRPLARRALLAAAACALATTMEPSGDLLTAGQVSPILIYLGLALIICAQLSLSTVLLVIGLLFACLKPQVGLLLLVAFALSPSHRAAVTWAVLGSALLALPQIIPFGLVATARGMLANIAAYSGWEANSPLAMTGPSHLLARMGMELPLAVQFALALLCAVTAGVLLRRSPQSVTALAFLFAAIAALVPLHSYDMSILLIVAALVLSLHRSKLRILLVCAALLLIIRPSRIESLFAVRIYADVSGGAISYSVAAILLLAIASYDVWVRRPLAPVKGN